MSAQDSQRELSKFYKPYLSDEEDDSSQDSYTSGSGSGSSSESSGSDSESDSSSMGAVPTSATQSRQNLFVSNGAPISSGNDISPTEPADKAIVLKQTKTAFAGSKNTTTIMINSSDRDTTVYPQPTFFTMRLPRIYRNVVGINITQIKLLSSFYYFSALKANTNFTVQELGRVKTVGGVDVSNAIDIFIRDGTYTSTSLVTELNNQLNQAPIYSRISYSDFQAQFITTGDLTLLFNDPGDTTYNLLTGLFDNLGTKTQIISRYFNTTNGNLGIQYYSTEQTTTAYYYAMLRDMSISQRPVVTFVPTSPFRKACTGFVNTGSKPTYPPLNYYEKDPIALGYLNGTSPYDRIVYGFQGLDDPYIVYILKDASNLAILEQYRSDNTWNAFLVNKYICSYDSNIGRMTIYSNQLNTSIVTTLNNQYQTTLIAELTKQGISTDQVASLQTSGQNMNGVIIDMYNKIQRAFTNFFAVPYGEYAAVFFTNLTNELSVFDASGNYGWNLTYTGLPQATTGKATYPDASGYWPRIQFNPNSFSEIGGDYYYPPSWEPSRLVQYTRTTDAVADLCGNIVLGPANEETLGFQDISFNVLPTAYSRVHFTSRCRQQMFIEAIPPFKAEIPPPNVAAETYYLDTTNTPLLFGDAAGTDCLLDPLSADFIFFDISQNMFDGPDFMRYVSGSTPEFIKFIRETLPVNTPLEVPPPGYIGLYTFRPHVFFRIIHSGYPIPQYYQNETVKFKSDIYIEREDGLPFGTDLDFYWYRSRAGFMADVSRNLINVYDNNSKHYFLRSVLPADVSGVKITLDFLAFQYSYGTVIARNPVANMTLRIFVLRHDPYGVYTRPLTSDYRLMPVDYSYLATKSTPATNFPKGNSSLFNSKGFRNSYDLSGISNNLLDHIIISTDFSHYDPYDFTDNTTISQTPLRFVFQFKTAAVGPPVGTSTWSQYFSSRSANTITDISNGSVYYNSTSAALEIANGVLPYRGISNEYVFANWFRAGATTNLINAAVAPVPEQTIAPLPVADSPFTIFAPIPYSPVQFPNISSKYKVSPFVLCHNTSAIATDISFNDLSGLRGRISSGEIYLGPDLAGSGGLNITNLMGITFMPPRSRYIVPKRVVLKYAYIQPSFDNSLNRRARSTPLQLSTGTAYRYYSSSSSTGYKNAVGDMAVWDDQFYQNRRNLVLGVFRTSSVLNSAVSGLRLSDALTTLSLKKVVQVGQYSSNTDQDVQYTRNRTPEWGTYYVYENTGAAKNLWYSWNQTVANGSSLTAATATTRWAAVALPADLGGSIFAAGGAAALGERDNLSYYTDVSNNSLCFIPFAPVLTSREQATSQDLNPGVAPFSKPFSQSGQWQVGSFSGLTYTTLPYIPITGASALHENPYVFYNNRAICVENIGNAGVSMGGNTTYLGAAGPLCLGVSSSGTIVSPNYRKSAPFCPTFFNIRVNLSMSDVRYNPLTDLTLFGGAADVSQCLVDTQTYLYDLTAVPGVDFIDISGAWGCEKASRFLRFDDDSGFNYLSYMPSINIKKGHTYGVNVRGYVPTVKFLTGLRIVGKNWTDFGVVAIQDLIDDIAALLAAGISINPDGSIANNAARIALQYTYEYTTTLLLFNAQFSGTFTMGRGTINAAYPGVTIVSTGFGDFINQFIAYNTNIQAIINGINAAAAAAQADVQDYITKNYGGILPPMVLTRARYTDPIMFSILFQSKLVEPQASAYDQWGLGWNLGFDKIDTGYNTRQVAVTFIRIVDDYIYLKLDDELNINNLDVSNKENLALSRDTAGQSRQYYGKILLNTFGSFCQTLIQAAAPFTTPLGRLDKLTFQLVDQYGRPINNNDCEYNIVISVDEMLDVISTDSMLIKGT